MSLGYYKQTIWNPDDYTESLKFYDTAHEDLLQDYIDSKFEKNKNKLDVRTTAITSRTVNSMSTIYKEDIKRTFKGEMDLNIELMVEAALEACEQYRNLDGISCLYVYQDNTSDTESNLEKDEKYQTAGEWKIKALPAAKFTAEMDGDVIASIFFRWKQILDSDGSISYKWLQFNNRNKQVYEAEGKTFSNVTSFDKVVGTFNRLPFYLVQDPNKDFIVKPSVFVKTEKSFVGDMALNRLSLAIAALRMFVATGAKDDDIKYMSGIIGNMTGIVGLPNSVSQLESVDMGSSSQNVDFSNISKAELRMLAVQYGANYTVLDVDDNLESGKAKQMKLDYMGSIRRQSVKFWKMLEVMVWRWLTGFDSVFKELEDVDMGSFTVQLTDDEIQDLREKEYNTDRLMVIDGTKTHEWLIRKYNPDYTDQEVNKEVENGIGKL